MKLKKHYGKSAALKAGFDASRFEIIITLDGDLQDVPAEIPKLLECLDSGADMSVGWRHKRADKITKIWFSKIFNKLTSMLTGLKIHDFNPGFKAFKREVAYDMNLRGELHRYIPALAHWQGYRVDEVKVSHRRRRFGHSKYGSSRLLKGFLDLITVKFLMTFSSRPLHLFGTVGFVFFVLGFSIDGYLAILWFKGEATLHRIFLLLLGILLMMTGLQLFSMGLLGEMISQALGKPKNKSEVQDGTILKRLRQEGV